MFAAGEPAPPPSSTTPASTVTAVGGGAPAGLPSNATGLRSRSAVTASRRALATAHVSPPHAVKEAMVPWRLCGVQLGWSFKDPALERTYAYRTLVDTFGVQVLMLVYLIVFRAARIISLIVTSFSGGLAIYIVSGFTVTAYLVVLTGLLLFKSLGLDKQPYVTRRATRRQPAGVTASTSVDPSDSLLLIEESPLDLESVPSPELSAALPPVSESTEADGGGLLRSTPSPSGTGGAAGPFVVVPPPPAPPPPPPPPSESSISSSSGVAGLQQQQQGQSVQFATAAEGQQQQPPQQPPQAQRRTKHAKLSLFLLWYFTSSLYVSLHWYVVLVLGLGTQFLADWVTCGQSSTSGIACFVYSSAAWPVIPLGSTMLLGFFAAYVVTYTPIALATITSLILLLAAEWATLFKTDDPLLPEVAFIVVDTLQVVLLAATSCIFAFALFFSVNTSRRKRLVYLAAVNSQFARYRLEVARTTAFEAELNRLREEEVVASTASAVQEMTIGYASHQLRNPLHAAKVLLSELEESTTLSPRSYSNFVELSRAINQMSRITDDVLQHQRLLGGAAVVRASRTLIRELLSTVVQSYANTSGRAIMLAVEDDVPTTVSVDALRLTQAVSNGLSNAIAALPWWATSGNRIMLLVRVVAAPPLVSTLRRPAVVVEGRDRASPALAWINELGPAGAQLVVPHPGAAAAAPVTRPGEGTDATSPGGRPRARGAASSDEAARARTQPAITTYNPAYQTRLCDVSWTRQIEQATGLAKTRRQAVRAMRNAALAAGIADPLLLLVHSIRNTLTRQSTLTVRHVGINGSAGPREVVPAAGEVVYEPVEAQPPESDDGGGSVSATGSGTAALFVTPPAGDAATIPAVDSGTTTARAVSGHFGPSYSVGTPVVQPGAAGQPGVPAPALPPPAQPETPPAGEAPQWQWWLHVEVINETQGRTPLAGKNVAELFNPFTLGGPVHDASAARIAHTGLGLPICTLLAASLSGRTGIFDDTGFPVDFFYEEEQPRWAQALQGRPTPHLGADGASPAPLLIPSPGVVLPPAGGLADVTPGSSPQPGPSPPSAPAVPPTPGVSSSAATHSQDPAVQEAMDSVVQVPPLAPHSFSSVTTTVTRFFFSVPLQLPLVTASADELLEAVDWFDSTPLAGIDVFANPSLGAELQLPLGVVNPVSRHWIRPQRGGAGVTRGPPLRQWQASRGHRRDTSGSGPGVSIHVAASRSGEAPRVEATPTAAGGGVAAAEGPQGVSEGTAVQPPPPHRSPQGPHHPPALDTTPAPTAAPAPARPATGGAAPPGIAPTPHHAATPAPGRPATRRFRALVVDDEETNRRINARLMTRLGADVETARDGDEVPTVWEAAVAQGHEPPFDVVCLDVIMRRVHGTEAAQWLRRDKGFAGPIIAATGNATEADQKAYRDMGFTDVLVKPFSLQDLRGSLQECGVLRRA